MSSSKNAKIQIETGQTLVAYAAMTDSGDQQVFTISGGTLWSGKSGYVPTVRPNGIVTGRNVLSASTSADTVVVAGFTAYSKSVLKTVTETTATITRATGSFAYIVSITMASDGTIAKVNGTKGASDTFSETRAAVGGPPLIPVNSVEIGQVRITASTAAVLESSEILQVVGQHTERYDYPTWSENNIGDGAYASEAAKKNAYVEFDSALPKAHTGAVPKAVWTQYYTPVFAEVSKTLDFTPAENSHSTNSEEYYNGTVGSVSSSLNGASFSVLADDNISDAIVAEKDNNITVRFYPDRNKNPYILTQGTIGISRSFPVGNQNKISVTVAPEKKSAEFTS
jgi:hypothetical protein